MAEKKQQVSQKERTQKAIERKQNLAAQKGTRVQFVRVPDTHIALTMLETTDKALRYIRDRVFTQYSIEMVTPLMEEWRNILISIDTYNKKICKQLKFDHYKTPDGLNLTSPNSQTSQNSTVHANIDSEPVLESSTKVKI